MRRGRADLHPDQSGGTLANPGTLTNPGTLANPGPIGGTGFAQINTPLQAAIPAPAGAELTPVVDGDLAQWELVSRLLPPLCLAFEDRRLNDGADAAHFLAHVGRLLADPGERRLEAWPRRRPEAGTRGR